MTMETAKEGRAWIAHDAEKETGCYVTVMGDPCKLVKALKK